MNSLNAVHSFDAEAVYMCLRPNQFSKLSYGGLGLMSAASIIRRERKGRSSVASDGLKGVLADGVPVSATIIVLQEREGVLIEVQRIQSADGSWSMAELREQKTHALAFKDGFNAGIIANIELE